MKQWASFPAALALLVGLLISTTANADSSSQTDMQQQQQDQCGLYLAISSSSTAEETTWGIYAGKDLPKGTRVGYPEIGIIAHNLKANNYFHTYDDEHDNRQDMEEYLLRNVDFLEELIWVASSAGAHAELPAGRGTATIPGPGALASFDAQRTNADWNVLATYKRPAWGETAGAAHANRGANSLFYSATVQTTRDVAAGSELFMDYGANWSDEAEKDDLTPEDYKKLDETVEQMIQFFAKHAATLTDATAQLQIYQFLVKDVMTAAVGVTKARKVQAILPPRPEDLPLVVQAGGVLRYSEPAVHRAPEWLQQHGLCMDHLQVGPSTIPHAGRGAFATRFIPAGGLVAPVPLIHIPEERILEMHPITRSAQDGDYMRSSDVVTGYQLLLNYVLGHAESTMIFVPTGPGVCFINHGKDPQNNNKTNQVNAKLVWSSHPGNARDLFDLDPQVLLQEENLHIMLLMEVVATRDIQPGEEVFLDYGHEWEVAWQAHVQLWEERKARGDIPAEWPIKAVDLMDYYQTHVYKTPDELEKEPYPQNVRFKAFVSYDVSQHKGTNEDPLVWGASEERTSLYSLDTLHDVTVLSRHPVEQDDNNKEDDEDDKMSTCRSMPYTYRVKVSLPRNQELIVDGVPHKAFVFVDAPGTSDQFFLGTFRHYIGIPDDVFPAGPWRNLVLDDDDDDEDAEEG